ncbi:hypothetical protein BKA69DRAFT_1037867 [Paraphysoderma sedebokerense]|nr:hypothetical protein BKA69DRAFT_1037867 [Paraphysoderma sedebokerense]
MPKKSRTPPAKSLVDDIPDFEKQRIVQEKFAHLNPYYANQKITTQQYFAQAVFLSIPLTILFVVIEFLSYYQFHEPYTFKTGSLRSVVVYPMILILVFVSHKYVDRLWMQGILWAGSVGVGIKMLGIVSRQSTFGMDAISVFMN